MNEYIIHPGVQMDDPFVIGPYVLLGVPPQNRQAGELETHIGANAVLRSHTVIYAGNRIGRDFQTGHGSLIREENVIGHQVSIGSGSVVEHHVMIGDGVRIHSQAFIPEYTTLEENSWIGPNVVITNTKYPRSPRVKEFLDGVTIKKQAKIGANCTLLPGIEIGEFALVGAGSVVTEDVPPRAVVVGNPARIIKYIDDLPYEIGHEP